MDIKWVIEWNSLWRRLILREHEKVKRELVHKSGNGGLGVDSLENHSKGRGEFHSKTSNSMSRGFTSNLFYVILLEYPCSNCGITHLALCSLYRLRFNLGLFIFLYS